MCNIYLQDRPTRTNTAPARRDPGSRNGGTRDSVSFASDNCRDPFYGYGDHDMLEVFTQAVRITHIDLPMGTWPRSVTATPIEVMDLAGPGLIEVGQPADLVLSTGRGYSELLARPQSDRVVLAGWRSD